MGDDAYFGHKAVSHLEKTVLVGEVFHSVAYKYDLMNDAMSLGIHRLWKRRTIVKMCLRPGMAVLDLAGGTGDFSLQIAPKVGKSGRVVLSDINASMLSVGQDRVTDAGLFDQIECVQANAECLPFEKNQFDRIIIAFGLRNVSHQDVALQEMLRVLKPGGMCAVLEFSKVVVPGLNRLYDAYSKYCIPTMGKVITGDEASYDYLVQSIQRHPDQETLKDMMTDAGFYQASYCNFSAGIVALHWGYKV